MRDFLVMTALLDLLAVALAGRCVYLSQQATTLAEYQKYVWYVLVIVIIDGTVTRFNHLYKVWSAKP